MFTKKAIAAFVFLSVLFLEASALDAAPGQIKTFSVQLDRQSPQKYRYWLEEDTKPISFLRAMNLLENSISFRLQVLKVLKEAGVKNIYWECPPISRATMATQSFEFVVIESTSLQRILTADPTPFKTQLALCKEKYEVISFKNSSEDAELVEAVK